MENENLESSNESQEEVINDESSQTGQEDPNALFRKHKHKIKVDDTEEEVDYDELIKNYQKGKAADKRFQEAAQTKKQSEQAVQQYRALIEQAFDNPEVLFKHANKDAREWAEKYLLEKMDWESKSDAEKKAFLYDQEQERQKIEREALEKKAQAEQNAALEAQILDEVDKEINEVLSSSGLKPTPRTIYRIAEYVYNSLDDSGKPALPAAKALERVKKDYAIDLKDLLGSLSPEETVKFLGDDIVSKVHKHKISALQPQVPAFQTGNVSQSKNAEPKRRRSIDEILAD